MAADVPEEVKWSVNDVPGGDLTMGTINEQGVYTAPAVMPSPREIHIGAHVPQAANQYLFATVIIGDAPITYKSVHIWAEKAGEEGAHLSTPHGIGMDKNGNILIADMGNSKVHRYTRDGKFIDQIGKGAGRNPGEISKPREVTRDVEGHIVVSDSKGDRPRIQIFSHEGEFLKIFAEKGRLPGMLLRAHGMDHDAARNLFVVDVENMRVNVYDQHGKSLRDWGTEGLLPGQFNAPHGLFADRSGDVFVTGYYGPTQKFNGFGDFVTAFAHGNPPNGPSYFHSVAGDKWGNAYLSVRNKGGYDGAIQRGDEGYYSIMKYNNNGDFICGWSYSAKEHSESEVVVDEDGKVYCLFNGRGEAGVETFMQE
ncbi:MAG: NHL repeat-containing protein [Pirellulales bacterium]